MTTVMQEWIGMNNSKNKTAEANEVAVPTATTTIPLRTPLSRFWLAC